MDRNHVIDFDALQTRTIQQLLGPIIQWVTSLQSDYQPQGGGPNALEALKRVKASIEQLLHKAGQVIVEAERNRTLTPISIDSLEKARNDVIAVAERLLEKGDQFVQNTSNYAARQATMDESRQTLMAVARLLIVADMVDANKIDQTAQFVRETIDHVRNCADQHQLVQITQVRLKEELEELTRLTRRRLPDLAKREDQDNLQSAMALLKITTPILISASKVHIGCQNAGDPAIIQRAAANRQFAYEDAKDALHGVSQVMNRKQPSANAGLALHSTLDPLIQDLENFKRHAYMEPVAYRKKVHRGMLEELLERIAVHSANVADEAGTQPLRRKQIVDGVNNLRQTLQDLLQEYEKNVGKTEPSEDLDMATIHLEHKLKDLRRHLRRAIIDQISDAFSGVHVPLQILLAYAERSELEATEAQAEIFREHAENLCRVALLVCKMSPDPEGVGILRYSAHLLERLTPQVIDAAILRCLRTRDPDAKENLMSFAKLWQDRADAMTLAVDSLISVDDFIAVSRTHICEDVKNGITAIYHANHRDVDLVTGMIRGRCFRVNEVVNSAMELLPASSYSENVRNATLLLKDAIPNFEQRANKIIMSVQKLEKEEKDERDEEKTNQIVNDMVDACDLIDAAVDGIRHALLMNRNVEDVDSDNEYEEDGTATGLADQRSQISDSDVDNQQRVMRHLPEQDKQAIQKQIERFRVVQRKFEYEVGRWDEEGNDIIALAKQMGAIMMDMTNFTKGRGPYRTTKDIIKAAQEISEKGKRFETLARSIGEDCAESSTKKDLYLYMERIQLFCHQLCITSKVKAQVQVDGDELRVSGLEGVTSLIQNARNLLSAVMLAVKSAYIASTKHHKKDQTQRIVEWTLASPQKQQSMTASTHRNGNGIMRRVSERRVMNEMTAVKIH